MSLIFNPALKRLCDWKPTRISRGKPLPNFRVLSTHLFLNHRLHAGLLDIAGHSGAQALEIFAARQHFDYTSREHVKELADWFASNPIEPFSLHAPVFPDRDMGRAGGPGVNLLHPDKSRRIEAMDEIKRALETAEHISFRHLIVHLGDQTDTWSPRAMEYALTALEHLGAFARPLGVRPLVENLLCDPSSPEHLMEILEMGHLENIGVCLDLGHAHATVGVPEAVGILGKRISTVHVHDNHGMKDEHLWPGDGTIDWPTTIESIKALQTPPAIIVEISKTLDETPSELTKKIQAVFARFE